MSVYTEEGGSKYIDDDYKATEQLIKAFSTLPFGKQQEVRRNVFRFMMHLRELQFDRTWNAFNVRDRIGLSEIGGTAVNMDYVYKARKLLHYGRCSLHQGGLSDLQKCLAEGIVKPAEVKRMIEAIKELITSRGLEVRTLVWQKKRQDTVRVPRPKSKGAEHVVMGSWFVMVSRGDLDSITEE